MISSFDPRTSSFDPYLDIQSISKTNDTNLHYHSRTVQAKNDFTI